MPGAHKKDAPRDVLKIHLFPKELLKVSLELLTEQR